MSSEPDFSTRRTADPAAVMYHIEVCADMLEGARMALVPGSPERTALIASRLDRPRKLADHRGLQAWLGYLDGTPVVVQTSGMGCPSLEIVVQELLLVGIRGFLRVGTTGSIQPRLPVGGLAISEGAVRLDGTSAHYAPMEYPAVADLDLTRHLVQAARRGNRPWARGITASSASFYAGQERYDSGTGYVPRHMQGSLAEWQRLGVLNYEMEAAALFVLARTAGARAGCICGVVAHRTASEAPARDTIAATTEAAVDVALDAVRGFLADPTVQLDD